MRTSLRTNSIFLKGLCVVIPIITLVAAHYFPFRRLFGRNMHPLEAYAIGTTAIVGTASAMIAVSEGDREDHVIMLVLATGSAALATIASHVIDAFIRLWGKISDLEAQNRTLTDNGRQL